MDTTHAKANQSIDHYKQLIQDTNNIKANDQMAKLSKIHMKRAEYRF